MRIGSSSVECPCWNAHRLFHLVSGAADRAHRLVLMLARLACVSYTSTARRTLGQVFVCGPVWPTHWARRRLVLRLARLAYVSGVSTRTPRRANFGVTFRVVGLGLQEEVAKWVVFQVWE